MIKDCSTCIHNRICPHKNKNEEYKKQMRELIEEWGIDNPWGYTEDCLEWHESDNKITMDMDKCIISFGSGITIGNGSITIDNPNKEVLKAFEDLRNMLNTPKRENKCIEDIMNQKDENKIREDLSKIKGIKIEPKTTKSDKERPIACICDWF